MATTPTLADATAPDVSGRTSVARQCAAWALLIVAAVALGVYGDRGNALAGSWGLVAELGLPWVALAVLWGSRTATPMAGAVAGTAGVATALTVYVLFKASEYGWDSVDNFVRNELGVWVILAIAVCGPAGYLAPALRRPGWSRAWALGLLAGVAFAEAGVWWGVVNGPGEAPAIALPVIRGELAAGALLLLVAVVSRRCRPLPLLVTAVVWTAVGLAGGWLLYNAPGLSV